MIVMIDNYDSFTYNLVQYLGELGAHVRVYRNDKISVAQIKRLKPTHIVISPGPCTPKEAGVSNEVISAFHGKYPILGVCLGHQCIGYTFGGRIIRAKNIMHGKVSQIYHQRKGLFKNIKSPFEATRYHSLLVERKSFPKDFEITAWTKDREIMGLQHVKFPTFGVQFHPESILTRAGKTILANFLNK
ncbi:MAG: anthranilate/aminodeoxychorismate synthase component II [Candidatus Omnitrophica bacterium CG11_big_fil_rev_8_21_14_0_20_45_26]|uniref:Anthranilate/aminodeoxychorismate synthase component II n=1 Tax=Candidatus Abzuiibacterium crystallinum TaxID=1974748 RepID=A0A2H0LSD8_9BACT|nr:MAG: anthranilate/aminodeoxychorismate synthase component II [Candidatus Omnitrophica bacterium CG11_big_fil_rev_8_21_14_0_20_45_26]PIW65020.1 MAG: anthranilate/aminodeoxychorismate synthase component II [Candidatus Omnitrophica bacterium CG12_big_fil_rev_8_21_14_0_65_45_16]